MTLTFLRAPAPAHLIGTGSCETAESLGPAHGSLQLAALGCGAGVHPHRAVTDGETGLETRGQGSSLRSVRWCGRLFPGCDLGRPKGKPTTPTHPPGPQGSLPESSRLKVLGRMPECHRRYLMWTGEDSCHSAGVPGAWEERRSQSRPSGVRRHTAPRGDSQGATSRSQPGQEGPCDEGC